ncbi:MAG: M3 family oligoendopeptidase [Gemmatimonadetes bacterium]|nr:M3 family oligoendopeptidase [Gemmatimonadota bacterium]MYG16037.1 M3 family oligoendopeptidase [Gemmatimonadota bacterium]MYH18624.1 M3 family oligoendopeptidase [Gemmatimonadota bacterium]MYK97424.1 M3 family oligoendopeptidase [Gemmatimonadota bacterium]
MDWDLAAYFPAFDGPEMRRFKAGLRNDLDALLADASGTADLNPGNMEVWERIVLSFEDAVTRLRHLGSYVSCITSADANNEEFAAEEGALSLLDARMSKILVELQRGLKTPSDEVFEAFTSRPALRDARYRISRIREQSRHTMSTVEEHLASDLGVDGIEAWGRLYDRISGKLTFEMAYPDGRREQVPMSQRRALMEHPDRRVRRAAFEGGNEAWTSIETVPAAALNAIGGTRLTLYRHRGMDHYLDKALFQAAISRETLDAMFEAVFAEIDVARGILAYKARLMGGDTLGWYDLSAPLTVEHQDEPSWDDARALVHRAFAAGYPALADYTNEAFERKWIDWSPRPGKRPGAFCTGSPLTRESRVYMTYNDNMGDVLTLAHELGHAFHGHLMREERTLNRAYPMTLAESASTFGEMLLMRGLLEEPDVSAETRAFLLNLEASDGATYLMDIPVRFEFEKAFHEERADGEVGVSRLKEMMVETQRRVLGDVLDPEGGDPYFWASKLHFYITDTTFYNFPYTFGYLLSRGLFARYEKEGPDFLPRYEQYLKLTGSDTAENVVRQTIGLELTEPEFWSEAIRGLDGVLDQLKASVDESRAVLN